jgi:hypothetical protein
VGVAVDASGNVDVLDSGNYRVEQFTSSGTYVTQWGTSGSGAGQFQGPNGIAVDGSNNVYVSDGLNNNVQEFSSSGTYLNQWGTQGAGNGQFNFPDGVAIDSSGDVYVVDGDNSRVQEFTQQMVSQIAPQVITQPTNQAGTAGGTAQFVAAASGTPAPSVQWQVSTTGGASWANVPGATGATLSLPGVSTSMNGYQYRAVFDNGVAPNATTNQVTLTVNSPPHITTQPASQSIHAGTSAHFSAAATGTPAPGVQWQVSTNGGASWSNISGATSTTLAFSGVSIKLNGHLYRAVFANGVSPNAITNSARLTVTKPTLALHITGLKTITHGKTLAITVTGLVKGAQVSLSRKLGRAKAALTTVTSTGTRMVFHIKFTKKGTYKITASATGPNDNFRSASGTERVR